MWLSQFVEQYVANGAEMSEWRHAERLEASWTGGSLWSLQKGTYCPDGLQLFICARVVDVTWHDTGVALTWTPETLAEPDGPAPHGPRTRKSSGE